jgi:hypothetical protein
VKNPGRDLPIAIIGSLRSARSSTSSVALTAVGAVAGRQDQRPGGAAAVRAAPARLRLGATLISFGALVAITSVVLTILYGQTRITFAMCRDGLLPRGFAKLSPRQTPARITAVFAAGSRRSRRSSARGDREAGQHRHAVRVRDHQHRRDRAAAHAAGPRPQLQGAVRRPCSR